MGNMLEVVDSMLAQGFYVILNVHHYGQLSGNGLNPNEASVDPAVMETRRVNLWRQIAVQFKDHSPKTGKWNEPLLKALLD
jgi:endoglucanase